MFGDVTLLPLAALSASVRPAMLDGPAWEATLIDYHALQTADQAFVERRQWPARRSVEGASNTSPDLRQTLVEKFGLRELDDIGMEYGPTSSTRPRR